LSGFQLPADIDLSNALSQALETGMKLHLVMIAEDGQILRVAVPLSGFSRAQRHIMNQTGQ
jgi:invasion protein IalB